MFIDLYMFNYINNNFPQQLTLYTLAFLEESKAILLNKKTYKIKQKRKRKSNNIVFLLSYTRSIKNHKCSN